MVLLAKNIRKTFKGPSDIDVLKGIDLHIQMGKSMAIVGKSGEGKSTLLHILGTLEEPTSGELFFEGALITPSFHSKIRSEKIGFIFQFYNLLEEETLLDNLLLPIKIRRLPTHKGSFHYDRAHTLLAEVGLEDKKQQQACLLSGGEKQRGAIARALIGDPSIILADEPSGNLDSMTSGRIHDLLLNLACKQNKSLVIVTHDENLASLSEEIYVLRNGILCNC